MKSDETVSVDLWRAYTAETDSVPIGEAAGRIAATTIRQYPPGNPEIIPGMTYTDAIISRLKDASASGATVVGVNFDTGGFVDVLKHEDKNSHPDSVKIETYFSENILPELAIEIADYFCTGFAYAPYYHFAFHERDPLRSLPATLNFLAWQKSLEIEDVQEKNQYQTRLMAEANSRDEHQFRESERKAISLPEGFHRWTDSNICRRQIKDRLQDSGYVTIVRDAVTQETVGLLHARMGSLERLYLTEEWYNPFLFSAYQDVSLSDDPDHFFQKMKFHFGLAPEDRIMTISAQLLSPSVRGGDIFYEMMRSMAFKVRAEHARLPLLCEIPPEGTAHTLNKTFTDRIIFGGLKNGHPLVFCQKTSAALFPFIANKQIWSHALKAALTSEKQYKRDGFVPSSTDNPNVRVQENGDMGLAVFATKPISAGTRIAVFEGETYQAAHALALPVEMRDHAIQIAPQEYVFGYRGLAHCVCHSCEPNCGIRDLTEIFSVQDIQAGEQITWDYRCSENSTWILEACLCGSKRCTGRVKNFDSLSAKVKAEYHDLNMVSEWLSNDSKPV